MMRIYKNTKKFLPVFIKYVHNYKKKEIIKTTTNKQLIDIKPV